MANAENENLSGSAKGVGVKALPREDEQQMDPEEFARLLDIYDNSFRNIAEGEVVKGTVLKVTPSEVIVDDDYRSEGLLDLADYDHADRDVAEQPGDILDVLAERTDKPATD